MRRLRAISPLVAALLLILIGVAGSVLIYLWLTGFAGQVGAIPSTLRVELKIESVQINTTAGQVTIYVRNVGSSSIDVQTAMERGIGVYVYDSETGELMGVDTNANLVDGDQDGSLEAGEVGVVTASVQGLSSGSYYDVKLVILGVEYYYPNVKAG